MCDLWCMHNPGGGQIMSPPSWHFATKIMCVLRRRHLLRLNITRCNVVVEALPKRSSRFVEFLLFLSESWLSEYWLPSTTARSQCYSSLRMLWGPRWFLSSYLGDVWCMHNPGGGQIMSPQSRHFAEIMCVLRRQHLLRLNTTRYNAGHTCASGTDNAWWLRALVVAKTVPYLHSGSHLDAQICNI